MKKMLIAIPKGTQYVELEYLDGADKWLNRYLKIRTKEKIPNGSEFRICFFDEMTNSTQKK